MTAFRRQNGCVKQRPERYRQTTISAVKLREKLRTERTNLVARMIETWQEVPLVLKLMDGSDPLYGYIGRTITRCIRLFGLEPLCESIHGKERFHRTGARMTPDFLHRTARTMRVHVV